MNPTLPLVLAALLLGQFTNTKADSIVLEQVSRLSVVEDNIHTHLKTKPGNVLVVFDIDDTLLESARFFGGDTWYNWQRGREVKHQTGHTVVIAEEDKMTCLFSKLGTLYELGRYHATEEGAPALVSRLQERFDVIALTSRSPDYRAGTERELERAGFKLARDHLMESDEALAYDFDDGRSTRSVTFQAGIVMSTGLNKGKVLQDLLNRLNREYTAIFFVDDSWTNIVNVRDAWDSSNTVVKSFHYQGVNKQVSDNDLKAAKASQASFDQFLETAYPKRHGAFEAGQCD